MRNLNEPLKRDEGEVVAFRTKGESARLLDETEARGLQSRWETIQAGFIDEPRSAVEAADKLVSDAIQRVSQAFAVERSELEQQWMRGKEASTEDLRMALQRYRTFFSRLMSI
jgi:hypothetical protein